MRRFAPLALLLASTALAATSQEEIEAIADRVAGAMGEEAPEVEVRRITLSELGPYFAERVAEVYPADRLYRTGQMLTLLGLIDSPEAFGALNASSIGAVVGFYDTKSDQLYVVEQPADALQAERLVLAHEIAHYLDDRRWPLDFELIPQLSEDEVLARTAVMEGSALVQTLRFAADPTLSPPLSGDEKHFLRHWTEPHIEEYSAFSPYLASVVVAPYLLGLSYMFGGAPPRDDLDSAWPDAKSRLDAAMRAPPTTTAELIHPDRPLDLWQPPRLDQVLQRLDWTLVYEGSVGELLLAAALARPLPTRAEAFSPSAWTHTAIDTWRGDAFLTALREDGTEVHALFVACDAAELAPAVATIPSDFTFTVLNEGLTLLTWSMNDQETRALGRLANRQMN